MQNFRKKILSLKNVLATKLYSVVGGKASRGVKNILGEEIVLKSTKVY